MSIATSLGPIAYVEDLDAPELTTDDRHHLQRVLRLKDGDPLVLSDGKGGWQPFHFGTVLRPAADQKLDAEPDYAVGVAVALVKGERPDWMVQKLTEIGIDRLVVMSAANGVVTWPPERVERNLERFRRIAAAAAAQSRRSRLPAIEGVARFERAAMGTGVALADPSGRPIDAEVRHLLIGPEGGWSETERCSGLPRVTLGDQILRTETAATVAATLLVMLRSRLVVPATPPERNALCG